jgi:hypothetical protein
MFDKNSFVSVSFLKVLVSDNDASYSLSRNPLHADKESNSIKKDMYILILFIISMY